MPKSAMVDTRIFMFMTEFDLLIDERLVYLYLLVCPARLLHGLFEINILEVAFSTGISRDRVVPIFSSLQNHNLIHYSNRLIFVPQIAEFENFVTRLHSNNKIITKSFQNALFRYSTWRGETTLINNAYKAFCDFYKDDIEFLQLNTTVTRPSDDPHTTVTRPSHDRHATLAESSEKTSDTTDFPIKQPEIHDPHTTVARPSHDRIGIRNKEKGKGIKEYSPLRKGGAGENHIEDTDTENFFEQVIIEEEYDIDDYTE